MRGLLDTSVFLADERGRELVTDQLPDEAAVSIVTLAELELGVHLASSEEARAQRLRTLQATRVTFVALAVDDNVASVFAELVATARRRGLRPKVQDAWIAATARAHAVAVYTQDSDFEDLAVDVVQV